MKRLLNVRKWLRGALGRTGTIRERPPFRPGAEGLENRALLSSADVIFLSPIYHQFLGRAPDTMGLEFFSQQLGAGATAGQVALEVQQSSEGQTFFTQGAYQQLLGRTIDLVGQPFYGAALHSGATREQVMAQIAVSGEFFQKEGGGTSAGFLADLWQHALGRTILQSELNQRLAQLQADPDRTALAAQVFASPEYAKHHAAPLPSWQLVKSRYGSIVSPLTVNARWGMWASTHTLLPP
jgi:hypothetical protein